MYRQGPDSIRVRVLDPSFESMSRGDRSRLVWSYLAPLTDDQQADINMLLLRTPEEIKDSFANFEFEDPVPPLSLKGVAAD
jgi:stress-induced morphogen